MYIILQRLVAKLQPIQNKCLRVITGAYKATLVRALKIEIYTPPIDLYLNGRLAAFRDRLANSPVSQLIQQACKAIQRRLRNKRGRQKSHRPIPSLASDKWARTRAQHLGGATEGKRVLEAWKRRWQSSTRPDA
jgi:hypothetical protein